MKNATRQMAEDGTGIRENPSGIGKFFDDRNGQEINHEQAQDLFNEGHGIAVPNAGAGSYSEVFQMLGYEEAKPIEWSSSAGDWTFAIRNGEDWYVAQQRNRYPYHGFLYHRSKFQFSSYEEACRRAFR